MSRLLEADLLRLGEPVDACKTLRSIAALEPYLRHYAAELTAYADLVEDPSAVGFFIARAPSVALPGHVAERAWFAFQ